MSCVAKRLAASTATQWRKEEDDSSAGRVATASLSDLAVAPGIAGLFVLALFVFALFVFALPVFALFVLALFVFALFVFALFVFALPVLDAPMDATS
jgi:hypothetical protein